MFERLWVRIPALHTGWTFYKLICCKNCSDCLIRPKKNEKEARVGPFLKKEKMKLGAKYQTPIKTQIQRKYKLSLNTFYSIDS